MYLSCLSATYWEFRQIYTIWALSTFILWFAQLHKSFFSVRKIPELDSLFSTEPWFDGFIE